MFKRLFGRSPATPPFITVVSGLPRSGTSMMMQMLAAGGMTLLQDGIRNADIDNPGGYYELERVKQLDKGDVAWLPEARGKGVKIISALLPHLPPTESYRVLFMRRDLDEVLASQARMLTRRGETAKTDDETLKKIFTQHVQKIETQLRNAPNVRWLDVSYAGLVQEPQKHVAEIGRFLDNRLDLPAMARVADPSLWRNR
jgi:hypothetical protein